MELIPTLRGEIDRRILVNFRIDPPALDELLPAPFRPRTVSGPDQEWGIGGVCCIRLIDMRPKRLPMSCGFDSENAAHRIGVEWMEDGTRQPGVYVPRRDTSSRLNSLVGSHSFGQHYYADFTVDEDDHRYALAIESNDETAQLSVTARRAEELPDGSIFPDCNAASEYHECGCIGYSPSPDGRKLMGVELASDEWEVSPLTVENVEASYFENKIPEDAMEFDNALLMENIGHEWKPKRPIRGPVPSPAT